MERVMYKPYVGRLSERAYRIVMPELLGRFVEPKLGGIIKTEAEDLIAQAVSGIQTKDKGYHTRFTGYLGEKGEKIELAQWSRNGAVWTEIASSTSSVSEGKEYILYSTDLDLPLEKRAKLIAKFDNEGSLKAISAGYGEEIKPLSEFALKDMLQIAYDTGIGSKLFSSVLDWSTPRLRRLVLQK